MEAEEFITWVRELKQCNKTEAVNIAAKQLGVSTEAVWCWLRGDYAPSGSALILMRLLRELGRLQ